MTEIVQETASSTGYKYVVKWLVDTSNVFPINSVILHICLSVSLFVTKIQLFFTRGRMFLKINYSFLEHAVIK
jgi:hypothetical protein